MSDLIIKGMEMPRNKGLFYDLLLSLSFDGSGEIFFNRKSYPITEISTPHGRLIDADKLLTCLNALEYIAHAESGRPTFAEALEEIAKAPTIIEAEE